MTPPLDWLEAAKAALAILPNPDVDPYEWWTSERRAFESETGRTYSPTTDLDFVRWSVRRDQKVRHDLARAIAHEETRRAGEQESRRAQMKLHGSVDDVALTVRRHDTNDWWVIERLEHDGHVGFVPHDVPGGGPTYRLICSARLADLGADIEGPSAQMLEIAAAIERKASVGFKRVAVAWTDDGVLLWSPRNSECAAVVPHQRALDLAAVIRREVTP